MNSTHPDAHLPTDLPIPESTLLPCPTLTTEEEVIRFLRIPEISNAANHRHVIDLGAGNILTNAGVLSPGGLGTIMDTTIIGGPSGFWYKVPQHDGGLSLRAVYTGQTIPAPGVALLAGIGLALLGRGRGRMRR